MGVVGGEWDWNLGDWTPLGQNRYDPKELCVAKTNLHTGTPIDLPPHTVPFLNLQLRNSY